MLILVNFVLNDSLSDEDLIILKGSIKPSIMIDESFVVIDERTPKSMLSSESITKNIWEALYKKGSFVLSINAYAKSLNEKISAPWAMGLSLSLLSHNEIFASGKVVLPNDRKDEFVHYSTRPIPLGDDFMDSFKNRRSIFTKGIEEILEFHSIIIEKKMYDSTLVDITHEMYKSYFLTSGERTMLYGA
ncbi:MAG: Unknown protein [uncultured Sulfurovum sp.]|uniref:Uncharacterized protein n=1 Tax=uncultured Sulfurovum sp. TaxID=269237 RepID=A0A6S6SAD5_9BACT|nr:MAG: Unknown protein [uncultured Sulfurovum sp.]